MIYKFNKFLYKLKIEINFKRNMLIFSFLLLFQTGEEEMNQPLYLSLPKPDLSDLPSISSQEEQHTPTQQQQQQQQQQPDVLSSGEEDQEAIEGRITYAKKEALKARIEAEEAAKRARSWVEIERRERDHLSGIRGKASTCSLSPTKHQAREVLVRTVHYRVEMRVYKERGMESVKRRCVAGKEASRGNIYKRKRKVMRHLSDDQVSEQGALTDSDEETRMVNDILNVSDLFF